MSAKSLIIQNAQHLKSIFQNRGLDLVSGRKLSAEEVFKAGMECRVEDAMSTSNFSPLLPQTVVELIKDSQEPLLVGTKLLDRINHTPGATITFPALGALHAADVAEGQAFPEMQPQIGGATMTANVGKSGLAFKFTEEMLRASQWDLMSLMLRKAGEAMARHKEVKIFNYISSMGVPVFNNVTPSASYLGTTSGRDIAGAANGSMTADDLFDALAQVVSQGFMPNTLLMHPLTWFMWLKDPVLREFARNAGGGQWFASYGGNPVGKADWGGGLGVGSGQSIVPGGNMSGDTASPVNDYSQVQTGAPNVFSYFPWKLNVVVSPFVFYDPARKITDIYIFDSTQLGALIVEQDLTTAEWEDPSVMMRKVRLVERYGIGIYNEGQAIATLKNISVRPNEVTVPPQAVINNLSAIDHSTAISL